MSSMTCPVVIMLSLVVAIWISVILSHAVELLGVMLHTFPFGLKNGQIIRLVSFPMVILTKQI